MIPGPSKPPLQVEAVQADCEHLWWNPFRTGTATVAHWVRNAGNLRLAADVQTAVKAL